MKNNSITENKMFLQAISGIAISLSMLLGILLPVAIIALVVGAMLFIARKLEQ